MNHIHGFELVREQSIPELKTTARLYRHVKTGAELLSLINEDENKVFGISFRTPPQDSTGVAHILEHSVLCGSRKYPLKEPFVELLKGSLKTFLNAFTYPDKTCYPVASQNVQDFYNLIDVYLDAAFYPRLTPRILEQEGWHLEPENPDDPRGQLRYKGVVFNEMKGAYSSPDSVLAEQSQQSLFPGNTYGLDSGGDPKIIPQLTFEGLKSFHERYYHPSNARLFFYGDDDPARRLAIADEYLKDFEPLEPDSHVSLQPPFDRPRRITRPFAVGAGETPAEGEATSAAKGMITVNWLLPETGDPVMSLSLQVLEYILIGMPGSPLRKALIDSGLGDDLAGVGLESDLRQMYFSTGLKGMATENADRAEAVILDTLAQLAASGVHRDTVEAALNTIEFRLRENNTGSYPRGLVLMLRALTTWLYDSDPFALLAFEEPLRTLQRHITEDPKYFEKLIERLLLQNPHRTTVVLEPDAGLTARTEAEERERLEGIRQSLGPDGLRKVAANALELQRLQEAPDSPEALATIPSLKREDLDKANKLIPCRRLDAEGTPLLLHDLFTNGIAYLDVGFDLHALPQHLLPYVPLFGRALTELGTDREDYAALSRRISAKTGGIHAETFTSAGGNGDARGAAWLFLRGKGMRHQTDDLLAILEDILLGTRWDNQERFRQMALEEKARQERKLIPNGHQMVNLRLRAHFSEADWAAEQMNGTAYLFFLRDLLQTIEQRWDEARAALTELQRLLVNRAILLVNVTLDGEDWKATRPAVERFLKALPTTKSAPAFWKPSRPPLNEGLTLPAQVNYVGKGADLYAMGYSSHGSMQVISSYLRTSWLWERVRVLGGAYGAFCMFDRHSGGFTLVSYRDPNLLKTLDTFDETAGFLQQMGSGLDDEELTRAIIGAIGQMDTYMLPDAKGYISLLRTLTGDTDDIRQRLRDEVLGTTAEDFRRLGDVLAGLREKGFVKVLGSESIIEEAATSKPGWLTVSKVL